MSHSSVNMYHTAAAAFRLPGYFKLVVSFTALKFKTQTLHAVNYRLIFRSTFNIT